MSETVTASAVVYRSAGILIRGASGAGKSTLALMLIDDDGQLVGDDRVHLSTCHGRIVASGHGAVRGQIELRGRGLIERPFEPSAVVRLVVDLIAPGQTERLPEPNALRTTLLGVSLASQRLAANNPAAVMLVREALVATAR